jgi:hypothetical protein
MNKSYETQLKKYGGKDGFSKEMQRRRKLRTDYTKGGFDSESAKKAVRKRWEKHED